jgi:hypothetical protein
VESHPSSIHFKNKLKLKKKHQFGIYRAYFHGSQTARPCRENKQKRKSFISTKKFKFMLMKFVHIILALFRLHKFNYVILAVVLFSTKIHFISKENFNKKLVIAHFIPYKQRNEF